MESFQYRAINNNGKKIKGRIEANTEAQAKQLLKNKHFIVLEICKRPPSVLERFRQPKIQDICLFTRQLATLLAAGIHLTDALTGVAAEDSGTAMQSIIVGINQKVLEGYSLAQALRQYSKIFSNLYCATIYAGEQSGQLDKVLNQLANYIEQQQQATQKIRAALIYPCLMIVVASIIIIFLMTQVVPKILTIFDDNQQALPLATKILIGLSTAISQGLPYFLLLIVVLGYIFYQKNQELKFKRRWQEKLCQLKIYRRFIQMTQIPRYLHTIRILLSSGVNVLESMHVAASLISNIIIQEHFLQASQMVKEGSAISRSLKNTGWFSSMSLYLIQSGEKSGQITEMMNRAALQIDNERQQWIDTSLKLLEPIIILSMGGFVLFIVLAILLPIFQMQQLI